MSNEDKMSVAQRGVVVTRWWWVRHAPVREDNGCIYGQKDLGCDTSDRVVFEAVAKVLPREAIWVASTLNRAAFLASQPVGSTWFGEIDKPAPGGESFMDLYNRVRGAIERINAAHAGRDVIAVAHGGTIKAAIGLALGDQPAKGLIFDVYNCSVTRLDHHVGAGYGGWRLPMVNQQPWIADASHNAMHQPAGPEIANSSKLA
jgi:alpha-ribazole phosphatase